MYDMRAYMYKFCIFQTVMHAKGSQIRLFEIESLQCITYEIKDVTTWNWTQ